MTRKPVMQSSLKQHIAGRTFGVGLPLILVVLALLTLLAILSAPPPKIETEFGSAFVKIAADRAWTILPGQCVNIFWELDGIQSLYVDGQGQIGWGEMAYCPTLFSSSPQFEITAQDGSTNLVHLDIHYLLNFLAFVGGFTGLFSTLLLSLYYSVRFQPEKPFPIKNMMFTVLALAVAIGLILLSDYQSLVLESASLLRSLFSSHQWQFFGVLLAGILIFPLIIDAIRQGIRNKATPDLLAICSFLAFVYLLYLPFGLSAFDSIAQWEDWSYHAWLDGHSFDFLTSELAFRFWEIVPHTLAHTINPNSFAPLHLVNFLIYWTRLIVLYGILRHWKVNRLFAYLITILAMVYPVNSALLSLRSLPWQFSATALLAAAYLILAYRTSPSRLRLFGVWLCMLFSIGANEAGYVLILIFPLICYFRERSKGWITFNLTVIWFLFPIFKVFYLAILLLTNQSFYYSNFLDGSRGWSDGTTGEIIQSVIHDAGTVYNKTFVVEWHVAWNALQQDAYVNETLIMMLLIGSVSLYLLRQSSKGSFPSAKQISLALLSGLLFVFPALGVLIWLEKHNQDPWRLYFYVPIGAAIAVFSLISLLTLPIAKRDLRNLLIISLCILIMTPATSRLLWQHANIVDGANRRAWILAQIFEHAPNIDHKAHVIVLTDMSTEQLQAHNIYEVSRSYLLYRMFVVLNPESIPAYASFCQIGEESKCRISSSILVNYNAAQGFEFRDLIVFRLNSDLSIQLLDELPSDFGFTVLGEYKPDRLIDTSAPIPPRALTMLASARRD